MVKKEFVLLLLVVFAILISLNFVFTSHVSSPATVTVNEDTTNLYTIIVNNTNIFTNATNVSNGAITQVNITLPSSFSFLTDSNKTSANGTFINEGNVLSWANTTNFLINGTQNNTYFQFNATASTPGAYNITITTLNATAISMTNLSVTVNDITAPVITLISPTNGNTSIPNTITFNYNVTDYSSVNCSLSLNNIIIASNNSGANTTGGTNSFINFSYTPVANTWRINCTDFKSNNASSATWSFSLSSFDFNGTVKDENNNILNNSVVNVTIKDNSWNTIGYYSGTSNASGWFSFSIASNSSWQYQPVIRHTNSTYDFVDFISKSIPSFPSQMLVMLAGTTFYLTPAGTLNITAVNLTGSRVSFQYQIKDTKLGYPVAEEHTNYVTSEISVYVPKNRNYSIMIYPNMSMPIYFNWNNFSSTSSYAFTPGSSRYNATYSTLHKQFNTTMTLARVTGYVNVTNITGFAEWSNLTVIPLLIEPGNMVHSQYGAMPYNLSTMIGTAESDSYNLLTGFYNITIPATVETSNILLFASAVRNSTYYGGFKNISLSYGITSATYNFTSSMISGLLGTGGNITMNRIDGAGQNIAIPTAKQTFTLVNSTNISLATTSAHIETKVDYSNYGATEFTWMSDVAQSQAVANFALPLLNITGIKEMNVFASGGPSGGQGQYAPKRVSTKTAAEITANPNITLALFNPGAIDTSLAASSISISLYISNSSCDIPNPPSSCLLQSSSTMASFNPMQAVMGGGKISFRMGYGGVLVHYVNVDMLASGPPDALFDSAPNTGSTSGSSFAAALRFGSMGPTIYDYILSSIPYTETAGSGLDDSQAVSISTPLLYNDNWNVIWNTTANGTNPAALAGNYSHYSNQADWGNLTASKTCITGNITSSAQMNTTNPCHIDTINNRIWIRIPHFSGTGPSVSGTTVSSSTSDTTGGGGGGSTTLAADIDLSKGYTKVFNVGDVLSFKIGQEQHKLILLYTKGRNATIQLLSSSQIVTLATGEEKKFELNNDSYYDLSVKLNNITTNITSGTKASFTITSIHESISGAPATITTTTTTTEEEAAEEIVTEEAAEGSNIKFWVIIAIVIVVIALVVAVIYYYYSKKKRYYKKGY